MFGPEDFAGGWQIRRVISDAQGRQTGTFDGTAVFTRLGPDRLHYVEQGQLRLGDGAALAAGRTYVWQFGRDAVEVLFSDARAFHRFVPGINGAGSDHPCGADLYRVQYDFGDWPRWRAEWRVQGPRKDYALLSDYDRG